MWLVYSDVHGPLWDITLRTRMNSGTRTDWLGRLLGFTTDERTGAARWDGIRKGKGRNELSTRATMGNTPTRSGWATGAD